MYYVIVTCNIEGYEKVPLGPFTDPNDRQDWVKEFHKRRKELNTQLGLSDGREIKARVLRREPKHQPGRSRALKGWPPEAAVTHIRRRFEKSFAVG